MCLRVDGKLTNYKTWFNVVEFNSSLIAGINSFEDDKDDCPLCKFVSSILDKDKFHKLHDFVEHI